MNYTNTQHTTQNTIQTHSLHKRSLAVVLLAVLLVTLFTPLAPLAGRGGVAGRNGLAAFTGVQASAAGAGNAQYLSADTLIASAAKYLGVPYKLGEKGYKNAYGENIRTYPMSMADIQAGGLDCSGLFYNALTDLGVSTEGYLDNHPVPLATASWFQENGAAYNSVFHINGQVVQPTVVYSGRTNGSRAYYYASNSGSATIEPGSLVVALPPKKNASGHCWIYLGEFANRASVVDYLVSLGVARSTAENYVGDGKGDGGTHWRIESTAGKNLGSVNKNFKGVMVDNYTNSSSNLGKLGVIQITTTGYANTENSTSSDVFTQTSPMYWEYTADPYYTGTVYGTIGGTADYWYVENGVVQLNAYGLVYSADHGDNVMVNHGRVDLGYTNSFSEDEHQTVYYVKNGFVAYDYTGAAEMNVDVYDDANHIVTQRAWWRVENGIVQKTYKGVAKNEYGWWYFKDGYVQFDYTGIQNNQYGWWRIENGKVNFGYTGVAKNEYGWWRVENGKVNFGFTGVASNEYGTWYIEKGKVNFKKNGKVTYQGRTYQVTNGKAKLV